MRRRSKKGEERERSYRKAKKEYLDELCAKQNSNIPLCEISLLEGWGEVEATDIHHIRGRDGELISDKSNFLALSRKAHNRIHFGEQHNGVYSYGPKWARGKGYLI